MAKLFKISAYIVDYNDEFETSSDLKDYLIWRTQNHITLNHISIQTADIGEWDDDHPLNRCACPKSEHDKYFEEN
jgi:hypothetical protein